MPYDAGALVIVHTIKYTVSNIDSLPLQLVSSLPSAHSRVPLQRPETGIHCLPVAHRNELLEHETARVQTKVHINDVRIKHR